MVQLICLFLAFFSSLQAADAPASRSIDDMSLNWLPCTRLFLKGCEMSVIHGHPSKKETDIFLRVPANYFIVPHWHHSAKHMLLISGKMEIKYKGLGPSVLSPGSFAYVPAGLPHQQKCISSVPCVLYINFDLPMNAEIFRGTL